MELMCSRLLLTHLLLLTCCHVTSHMRSSPDQWGLRPADSRIAAVPPLTETPDARLDPTPRDLNVTRLRARLGRHFNARLMSETRPRGRLAQPELPFRRSARGRLIPVGSMPKHLRKADFRHVRLADGSRLRTHVSAQLQHKLRQLLWAYTACPLAASWRDLGLRFWPRFLQEGSCPAGRSSCSIPPGMTCRPAARDHVTLLRFACRRSHFRYAAGDEAQADVQLAAPKCSWVEVKYPVVTKCACACPNPNDA